MPELKLSGLAWAIRSMISVETTNAGPQSIEAAAERLDNEIREVIRDELERYNVLAVRTVD
jgi:hypothetical protein